MAKKSKKHKGGSRRDNVAERYPSGQIKRPRQDGPTPEALAQRAAVVGEDRAMDMNAGSALGVLCMRRFITQRQRDAGLQYAYSHRKFCQLAGLPARFPTQSTATPKREVEPEDWQRAKERLAEIDAVIDGTHQARLVRSLLESVCIEDVVPPRIAGGGELSDRLQRAMVRGLDGIAEYFKLPKGEDEREDAA